LGALITRDGTRDATSGRPGWDFTKAARPARSCGRVAQVGSLAQGWGLVHLRSGGGLPGRRCHPPRW